MSRRLSAGIEVHKWTGEETSQLIASIKDELQWPDPLPYSKRIASLDWNEIIIQFPGTTAEEARFHLDVIIKKVRRTRSLAEILSDIDVDMVPKDRQSPVGFKVLKDFKNEMPCNDKNNNNAAKNETIKRKSKRLHQCSNESISGIRSHSTPLKLFANSSKENNNKDVSKQQFDMLTDREKLFWIRKSVVSLSEGETIEDILTPEEYQMLNENGHRSRDKKRKFDSSYDATAFNCKRMKRNVTPINFDIVVEQEMITNRQPIKLANDSQEVIVTISKNNAVHAQNQDLMSVDEVAAIESVSAATTQLASSNDPKDMNSTFVIGIDATVTFEPNEEMESETTLSNMECTNVGLVEAQESIKSEEDFKVDGSVCIEEKKFKPEIIETPRVISRIKNFCSCLWGRLGGWVARD